MADDNLRIVARVENQFTGPLVRLKKELGEVGDAAKKHGAQWRKDWSGVSDDMGKFTGVLGKIEPILSKIGMGGFSAAMSLGGAALAVKNFSGSTRDLDLMAKQIGLTANQLRTLSELGGKVGVSADTMKQGVQSFAGTMFELRQRWGQAYGELRNMNLGKLAEELVNAPNMQAGFERALDGLKNISDPQKLARVSILLFGTPDIGLVARSLARPAKEAIQELQRELGTIDEATLNAARRFEENLNRMHTRWENLKLKTLGPLLEGADKVLDEAEKERKAAPSRLKQDDVRRQIDVLDESIARKQSNGDEAGAAETKKKRDALIEEMKRLTDEIRKAREQGNGASVSPTGFNGGAGGGGGSLIQKAAWGGGGFGGLGNPDGMDGMRSRYPAPSYGSGPLSRGGGGPLSGAGGSGGPPGGVGSPAGAAGGPISRKDMRDVNPQMAEYIRQSALAHGIDPNVALRIANSEGLRGSVPGVRNTPGDRGTSFGPFQLHYGSNIPGLTLKGLGDRYTRETGHHASDPKHWKEQIDFALRTARKEGWGAWHGRYGARIGIWDGIGTVKPVPIPKASAEAPAGDENGNFPNGAPRALKPRSMAGDPSVPGQVVGEPGRRAGNASGRSAGDALMDRFYGDTAMGRGPRMQMPGEAAAGKGRLDIHLHGFPGGTKTKADVGGLFDDHTVTRSKPQMGMHDV